MHTNHIQILHNLNTTETQKKSFEFDKFE